MKKYTLQDALKEIFDNNKEPLSAKLLVYKHRHKQHTLSQKSIDSILSDHKFIVARPILYSKKKEEKKKKFPHIQPVRYLSVEIDIKTYNRVARVSTVGDGGTSDIEVNKWFLKRLNQNNEFVRLRCDKYYIDITIASFKLSGSIITISLGKIIDSNNLSRIIPKSK
ncbi:MAG: hypothetical protein V4721_10255 [Bacteroidota bacterium]